MKTIAAGVVVLGLWVAAAGAEPRLDDGYQPKRIYAEPLRGSYSSSSSVGHVEQRLSGAGYTSYRKPDAPAAGYSVRRNNRAIDNTATTVIVNDPARYADRDRGYYRADGVTYNDYRKRSNVVINTNLGYGYTSYRSGWYGRYGVGCGWGYPYRYKCYRPYRYGYYPRYHGGWYSGWNVGYRQRFGHYGRNSIGVGVSFGY